MIYTVNNELRTTILDDGTAEEKLAEILILMNDKTFGQREAASIVGGRGRLYRLIESGKIRTDKPTNKQNGKWFCNASDVLRHAVVIYRKPRKIKRNEKANNKRATA
ncbi:MAG: hypothetical protein RSD11_13145 [Bacteroides sp.]|uniref:hypothetical protein n=1 Tax=Bacteroides sp. TaxID=29523 RepID=UPI002FCB5D11